MASAAPGKAQRSAAGTAGGAATIGEAGSEEGQGPTPPCTPPDISLYGLIRARAGRSPQSTHRKQRLSGQRRCLDAGSQASIGPF